MPKKNEGLSRPGREAEKPVLQEIRLAESHCKLGGLKGSALPSRATQTIGLEIGPRHDGGGVLAVASFRLLFTYAGAVDGDAPLLLAASFRLQYVLPRPVSRKRLEDVVRRVALPDVWPYWRELAQSLTVRMGLPAFPLPLMRPARLEMVDGGNNSRERPRP